MTEGTKMAIRYRRRTGSLLLRQRSNISGSGSAEYCDFDGTKSTTWVFFGCGCCAGIVEIPCIFWAKSSKKWRSVIGQLLNFSGVLHTRDMLLVPGICYWYQAYGTGTRDMLLVPGIWYWYQGYGTGSWDMVLGTRDMVLVPGICYWYQ